MLNTTDFVLVAGQPDAWDAECRARTTEGATLVEVQEDQHARGRRSAELVHGMFGWYVRAASSLDTEGILANTAERDGVLNGSYDTAADWARRWAAGDPTRREVYVRRAALHAAQVTGDRPGTRASA